MALNGWHSHAVIEGAETATGFNVHTHGLDKTFGHRNFEIVMPCDREVEPSTPACGFVSICPLPGYYRLSTG
jgi:hypothetical protein